MVDSADIYFIQHFADIYFSKSVCISACRGYQVSRTYCQVSFFLTVHKFISYINAGPDDFIHGPWEKLETSDKQNNALGSSNASIYIII